MQAAELPVDSAFRFQRSASRSEQHAKRHHGLLAERVDGWIRDLRESLAQIAIEAAGRPAQRCDGYVVAHRVDRLGAGLRHRLDDELHILGAPTVQAMVHRQVLERVEVDVVALDRHEDAVSEKAVVVPRGGALLGLVVAQHRAVTRVDQQHLPRPEASAFDHCLGGHRDDAGFRRRRDEAIGRALPAQRPQSVAVERGADHDAVAERQRGRPVPWLEPDRLVAVEIAHRRGEVSASFPGVGDKAHQGLGHFPAAVDQQLESIVERRRVGSLGPDGALKVRLELGFARAHPRAVAGDRVDLAVVGEHAKWLRQAPVGHRVGRVALMKHREPALARGIAKVEVEIRKAGARHEALVDQSAAGEGRQVHADAIGLGSPFSVAPGEVEAALPGVGV